MTLTFRTLEGIAKETGLTEASIAEILEAHPELFRKSHVPDKRGRPLFTSAVRPIRWKERLAVWQSAEEGRYRLSLCSAAGTPSTRFLLIKMRIFEFGFQVSCT